jgi:YezG-like immunity protein
MNEQIEAMYGRIGQALANLIGDGYRKAFVHVEMADDFGSLGVFVDGGDGTYQYLIDDSNTLFDLFAELRNMSRTQGMGEWSQATFELNGGGRFSIQYGFDDISDLGQGSARRDAWMKQHLGSDARVKWS